MDSLRPPAPGSGCEQHPSRTLPQEPSAELLGADRVRPHLGRAALAAACKLVAAGEHSCGGTSRLLSRGGKGGGGELVRRTGPGSFGQGTGLGRSGWSHPGSVGNVDLTDLERRPLHLGVDICMASGTKLEGGTARWGC
ncbi:hypothetical protein HYH03_019062 [Edaphochlamys debaryana]|uniref:Uncharacterized protein n=1 Tax=Edaphochlamys debaryana TaxID=47281 RepID=A0A835XE35_9CHLO|nr:hypothetical protein HYH03_019062 [Edaphochlamys debaryana]|eukprot:KAG2481981.1 hypothetical protein HYH03_019062 [Edaphochlamys debaryana]